MTSTTRTTAKLDIMDDDSLDQAFATAKAHAAELREWAQKWWDAWNTQDLDGVVALVDENIVYEDPAMLGEPIRGRAQFRAFVEMFFSAFPDALFEQSEWPIYLATEGVGIAAPWRVTGT